MWVYDIYGRFSCVPLSETGHTLLRMLCLDQQLHHLTNHKKKLHVYTQRRETRRWWDFTNLHYNSWSSAASLARREAMSASAGNCSIVKTSMNPQMRTLNMVSNNMCLLEVFHYDVLRILKCLTRQCTWRICRVILAQGGPLGTYWECADAPLSPPDIQKKLYGRGGCVFLPRAHFEVQPPTRPHIAGWAPTTKVWNNASVDRSLQEFGKYLWCLAAS